MNLGEHTVNRHMGADTIDTEEMFPVPPHLTLSHQDGSQA